MMNSFKDTGIEHSVSQNDVNSLFFSKENVVALQQGIRYGVFIKINKVIDNQSERELRVIMRSIYLQYSKNLKYNIIDQVKELNSKILDYIIPKIISEIKQYDMYILDASLLPAPIDRATNTSVRGTKFLHIQEF